MSSKNTRLFEYYRQYTYLKSKTTIKMSFYNHIEPD